MSVQWNCVIWPTSLSPLLLPRTLTTSHPSSPQVPGAHAILCKHLPTIQKTSLNRFLRDTSLPIYFNWPPGIYLQKERRNLFWRILSIRSTDTTFFDRLLLNPNSFFFFFSNGHLPLFFPEGCRPAANLFFPEVQNSDHIVTNSELSWEAKAEADAVSQASFFLGSLGNIETSPSGRGLPCSRRT